MKELLLTRQQARAIDVIAIDRYGFTGLVLMENAGRGVVDVLLKIDPELVKDSSRLVLILCGKGNNAGDGFVIARHLELRSVRCKVVLLTSADELRGDALANYKILCRTDVPVVDLSGMGNDLDKLTGALTAEAVGSEWILDAMLGTGAVGAPREPFTSAIEWMNAQPVRRMAIDVPTGLDCDTGVAATLTVRADQTCTFVARKQGFVNASAARFLGQLHVVSIGIPHRLIVEVNAV